MSSALKRAAVVVSPLLLTFSLLVPVDAAAAESKADQYAGGIVSAVLDADGSVKRFQPEPRNGSVEESRAIAARKNAVSDAGSADLATADEKKKVLASAAAEQEPPLALLDECLNSDEAGEPGGRVLNRHFWCQRNVVHGEYFYNGTKEGEFTVWFRAAAVGNPFTRQVHYFFHGDDTDTDGSFNPWSDLSLKVDCVVQTVGCSVDRDYVTMDIGDWDDGEWVNWNITSDETVATQAPEKVLRHFFSGSGVAVDNFGRVVNLETITRPAFRCDSATYFLNEPRACVFTDVIPRLNYEYGRGYDEVVTHIKTAFEHPELTNPQKVGKVVPGNWRGVPGSTGLNRVPYQGSTWLRNESAKNSACAALPPRQESQDCDEFPFAVTVQGAGFGDSNFSVKYLNDSQNRSAGGTLTAYLRWDRILYDESPAVDGVLDEFWVRAG